MIQESTYGGAVVLDLDKKGNIIKIKNQKLKRKIQM
jgi:hypothetical protein